MIIFFAHLFSSHFNFNFNLLYLLCHSVDLFKIIVALPSFVFFDLLVEPLDSESESDSEAAIDTTR
jgi:hypothetical protein